MSTTNTTYRSPDEQVKQRTDITLTKRGAGAQNTLSTISTLSENTNQLIQQIIDNGPESISQSIQQKTSEITLKALHLLSSNTDQLDPNALMRVAESAWSMHRTEDGQIPISAQIKIDSGSLSREELLSIITPKDKNKSNNISQKKASSKPPSQSISTNNQIQKVEIIDC